MSDVTEKIKEMIGARSCCAELKEAGQRYLDAAGTPAEADARMALLVEIDEDLITIEGLIEFLGSERGASILGDAAPKMLERAKEVKAAGGKYCFCDACARAHEVREMLTAAQ